MNCIDIRRTQEMTRSSSAGVLRNRARLIVFTLAAVAVWATAPFVVKIASTIARADAVTAPTLVASLTAPAGSNTSSTGVGVYTIASTTSTPTTTTRVLHVEVYNVNVSSSGVALEVFLNSTNIGSMNID